MRHIFFLVACLTGFGVQTNLAQEEARLLRFPTIHGDQIVFGYAGDLYTVDASGGVARRLTSDIGYEMFPRFSRDGSQIAFTAQYDGNTEVYVMPAAGGIPKRLTYTATLSRDYVWDRMGPNNLVMGWTGTDNRVVFRSRMKEANDFNGQLYLVGMNAEVPDQIPVPRGGFCSYSPDDTKFAYNRVFREFRTWKRYRGGMADDIWIYDKSAKTVTNLTNNPAQDIIPMWHENRIYFLSDRDENKRMNLFVHDLADGTERQLTSFKDFDVKFPSLGDNAIVFENGGELFRFDLALEKSEKVPVSILEDRDIARGGIKNVKGDVSNYEIAPDGNRALFGAHGEIFTVPKKNGVVRNLTNSSGVHERNSKWSPDGKWIAYISDSSGEDEIYIMPQSGNGPAQKLTTNSDTYKYQMYWSPDSKKLLWSDKKLRLQFVDIETKKVTVVDQSVAWEINDYAWSPDNKWITYAKPVKELMTIVFLYAVDGGQRYQATGEWYDSFDPVFSTDGKYLFFRSNRDFSPTLSNTELDHVYVDMNGLYLVTLAKETESPFKPKSDEVVVKEPVKDEKKNDEGEKKKEDKKPDVKIDPAGLPDRVIRIPVQASAYSHLTPVGDKLYYNRQGSKDQKRLLLMYDLTEQKETELGQINGYEISADEKKMLVSQNGSYAIIDLPKGKIDLSDKLDLSGMEMDLNLRDEWAQIFDECWRQMRDFFYAPTMHGVDWKANGDKYRALVPFVNHRADLTYVIGEMIGELNVGHAYVGGGDMPNAPRIRQGLLGAEIVKDAVSGYYRIEKILKGRNWDKDLRSPLTEIGVNVKEGDFIIAVDGKSTKGMANFYQSLVNKVNKQVVLRVNSQAGEKGAREVVVLPIDDEQQLVYHEWVQSNIKKVSDATGGKVGYLHIPDMGLGGLNAFVKYFYPQLAKKALIVDVRGNGGGFVSPMIIERLVREIMMVDMVRNTMSYTDPGGLLLGPKVCLMDEFSASDGDLFPFRFRKSGLGKLIGKRSWGGVVGIRGSLPLVDGGYLRRPEFASYNVEGTEWIIEGHGVEPDIYVDNDPIKEFEGIDQQLERAIEVILEELKTGEKTLPPPPPFPDKQ